MMRHHHAHAQPAPERPRISVLMPIRNEADFIARSLQSVLAQTYPTEQFEVLILDGMSSDATRAVIARTLAQQQAARQVPDVRLLDNSARTAPHALNIGLRHASGDVILRVDGHCVIAADYLERCITALHATNATCAGGPMETIGTTFVAQAIACAQSSIFGVGGVAFRTGRQQPGYVDTVAFGAYRRAIFDQIGGFDEELVRNQDDEFNFRLTQAGGRIWLDPSIRSRYFSRASLHTLWRQYYQYGLYKVRVIQKRGGVASWRHLVPALFVLGLLGSVVLAVLTGQWLWLLSCSLPYALANLLASILTARRNWRVLPLLPIIFATLHLAYGTGFLRGVWHWRGTWVPKLTNNSR